MTTTVEGRSATVSWVGLPHTGEMHISCTMLVRADVHLADGAGARDARRDRRIGDASTSTILPRTALPAKPASSPAPT